MGGQMIRFAMVLLCLTCNGCASDSLRQAQFCSVYESPLLNGGDQVSDLTRDKILKDENAFMCFCRDVRQACPE